MCKALTGLAQPTSGPVAASIAKGAEQGPRYGVSCRVPFRVPLHRHGEPRRVLDIDRLWRAIRCVAVNHDTWAGNLDPLPVQRVGHHFGGAQNTVKRATFGQRYLMAQCELFLKRAIWRHPVIVTPGQIADFRVERAAHRHVDLLKAEADPEYRLANRHTFPDQRQADAVAFALMGAMGVGGFLAIFLGVHIGPPAGKEKTVASGHQFAHADAGRIGGNDQGHHAGHFGEGLCIQRTSGMDLIVIIDQMAVRNDTNNGARHRDSICYLAIDRRFRGHGKALVPHSHIDRDAHASTFSGMDYDLSSREFLADPAPTLAAMRAAGPLVQVKLPIIGQTWMTTTDHAARQLLKQPELFARDPQAGTGKTMAQKYWFFPPFMRPLFQNMLGKDGAEHRRLRGLVEKAFNKTHTDDMRPRIAAIADRLLSDLSAQSEVDIIASYTRQLPLLVICDLLGLCSADRDRVAGWIAPLSGPTSALSLVRALPGLWRIMRYFRAEFARVRQDPGRGLITDLVQAEAEGDRLSDDELLAMVVTLFIAGHETTVHLITMGLNAVLRGDVPLGSETKPDVSSPLLIEEFMRFYAPVMMTKPHFVQQDTVFEGVPLKKGAQIAALLIAANHDGGRFAKPEDFIPNRRPNPHLGFGHGPHVCLGMQLARAEAQIALARFFHHFPTARLARPDVPPDYTRRIGIHGLKTLRVRLA